MVLLFWIAVFIVFYSFIGYGILLYVITRLKRLASSSYKKSHSFEVNHDSLPTCTLIIAAYNEAGCLEEKIKNCQSLTYPRGKLRILFVTDGSTDDSPEIILKHSDLLLLHQDKREGKIIAIDRAMQHVSTETVVFTDANAILNKDALINIAKHYDNFSVGAVSGEKRVISRAPDEDSGIGEGIYWKYESTLKKWDSELYSVVGAAGELFGIKTHLYTKLPHDTILDDFMLSMTIAKAGYRIVYEPDSYATETASISIREELKRRIRIAAGGIQSISRLKSLFNPFKHPILSFQYISHRVLRWTITPFLLPVIFFTNIWLYQDNPSKVYAALLLVQSIFYLLALVGMYFQRKKVKIRLFFIPFYFCVMNYAVVMGIIKYFRGTQSSVWEKAKR
ncbi:glycosyltransferase family 2 protein [Olivibacter sitiensis]|uniref:glycosyltransferase family 2 protein n=1 Tax=Olivibacter sitiensis TaxID=376470 RepID=UPI0003FDDFB2|nr:glycosyltransferase family 2 protein [Olivibacter sitiensis]